MNNPHQAIATQHQSICARHINSISMELGFETSSDDFENINRIVNAVQSLNADQVNDSLTTATNQLFQKARALDGASKLTERDYRKLRLPLMRIAKQLTEVDLNPETESLNQGMLPSNESLEVSDYRQEITNLATAFEIEIKIMPGTSIKKATAELLRSFYTEGSGYDLIPKNIDAFLDIKKGFANLLKVVSDRSSHDKDILESIKQLNECCTTAGILDLELTKLCVRAIESIDPFTTTLQNDGIQGLTENNSIVHRLTAACLPLCAEGSPVLQVFRPILESLRKVENLIEDRSTWKAPQIIESLGLLDDLNDARNLAEYYIPAI